jgi:hypothetical protein
MTDYTQYETPISYPIHSDYDTKIELAMARTEYRDSVHEMNMRFKMDLFSSNNIVDNPKAELLWDKAWDYGHSFGLSAVEEHFDDLIDLIL